MYSVCPKGHRMSTKANKNDWLRYLIHLKCNLLILINHLLSRDMNGFFSIFLLDKQTQWLLWNGILATFKYIDIMCSYRYKQVAQKHISKTISNRISDNLCYSYCQQISRVKPNQFWPYTFNKKALQNSNVQHSYVAPILFLLFLLLLLQNLSIHVWQKSRVYL